MTGLSTYFLQKAHFRKNISTLINTFKRPSLTFFSAVLILKPCYSARLSFGAGTESEVVVNGSTSSPSASAGYNATRLTQKLETAKIKCQIQIINRNYVFWDPENQRQHQADTRLHDTFCKNELNSVTLKAGMLVLDWSESVGLSTADEFAGRDFRYSPFLRRHDLYSQPTIQIKHHNSLGSWELYLASLYFRDEYRLPVRVSGELSISPNLDFGMRYSKSLSSSDLSLSVQRLTDRRTLFVPTLSASNELYLRTRNIPMTHLALGLSQDALGGILRADLTHSLNRSYQTSSNLIDTYNRTFINIGYDSPTYKNTIFSVQYSTERLLDTPSNNLFVSRSEWLLLSAIYRGGNSSELALRSLYNHFDKSSAYFFEYKWVGNSFAELFLRVEHIPKTTEGFFSLYSDLNRAAFGVELLLN